MLMSSGDIDIQDIINPGKAIESLIVRGGAMMKACKFEENLSIPTTLEDGTIDFRSSNLHIISPKFPVEMNSWVLPS